MVKKFKQMSDRGENQLASAIKESAQQIWLAGLGAFAKAQEEGGKVFDALVREGTTLNKRASRLGENIEDVTVKVGRFAETFQKQATGTWDRLEGVFEERVQRALARLGVPNAKEIGDLTRRVEQLTAAVQKLSGGRATKSSGAASKKSARPAAKRTSRTAKAAKAAKAAA